jgi:hypothetical protein
MKRIISLTLVLVFVLSISAVFASCNNTSSNNNTADDDYNYTPKVYDASDFVKSDLEAIAESYINSTLGKYWIEMWYRSYTVESIRIASCDDYNKSTSEDGKTTAYITAHGTFSIYDKYGQFVKSHTFDYRIKISGTFTSSYIKDIAKDADIVYLKIDGSRMISKDY